MITAQFDSIGYKHVLTKLKRDVLDELWMMMQKRTADTFFTVYLIVFMMLHEVSVACEDRRRRAMEHKLAVSDRLIELDVVKVGTVVSLPIDYRHITTSRTRRPRSNTALISSWVIGTTTKATSIHCR
jgi:hypothetical protein